MTANYKLAVLCDFDGTITLADTCVGILDRFARGDWLAYDKMLEKGEITLHECIAKQFGMIRASKDTILESIGPAPLRPGFAQFVAYCAERQVPLVIVSGGLDFVIEATLEHLGAKLPIIAAQTSETAGALTLSFPRLVYPDSADFKADVVRQYHEKGYRVVMVGDGNSDLAGARAADAVFAVCGSFLHNLFSECFENFNELQTKLEKKLHAGEI